MRHSGLDWSGTNATRWLASDSTEFEREWSAGRPMPVDAVVAYALESPQRGQNRLTPADTLH